MMTVNALVRRHWLNLGLLGLAGGLAALALFEPGRERPVEAPTLMDLAPARVERIRVERPGQEALAFERREGRWWMTAPDSGPANPVLIHPVLQLAEARCALRYAVAELDLPRVRLDPPRLRLWLNEQDIHFGDITPTDGRRYLRAGATVQLCPDHWYPLLTSAAGSFLAMPLSSNDQKIK